MVVVLCTSVGRTLELLLHALELVIIELIRDREILMTVSVAAFLVLK
jgi:hypothetical protein